MPAVYITRYYAFTDSNGNFSFSNIASLPDYASIFGLSLELSVIATFVCLVIGYPLAYIIAKSSPKHQKIFIMLLMLPMWTNLLIRTYSIMAILDNGGIYKKELCALEEEFVASVMSQSYSAEQLENARRVLYEE